MQSDNSNIACCFLSKAAGTYHTRHLETRQFAKAEAFQPLTASNSCSTLCRHVVETVRVSSERLDWYITPFPISAVNLPVIEWHLSDPPICVLHDQLFCIDIFHTTFRPRPSAAFCNTHWEAIAALTPPTTISRPLSLPPSSTEQHNTVCSSFQA